MYAKMMAGKTNMTAWVNTIATKPELLRPMRRMIPMSKVFVSVVIISRE